ncbi:MAG: hypothetical protein AAF772_19415, partial [Acidobacteriota bacterium]
FSALAHVDDDELNKRANGDLDGLSKNGGNPLPVFSSTNRALSGSRQAQPFNANSFQNGQLTAIGPAVVAAAGPTPGFTTALQDGSLMIVDPDVITDPTRTLNPCTGAGTPGGAWTFARLMTDMANQPLTGIHPSVFVEDWVSSWLVNQTVNGFTANARPAMAAIINDWRARSGGYKLDLNKAPFRLLAIVNRADLRDTTTGGGGYGGGGGGTSFLNAGEGRFIFGLVDVNTRGCSPQPFSVIFEYGVPLTRCTSVRDWAKKWLDLPSHGPIGSPAYNAALQDLTDVFATANANPRKPNGNAINQVRTNEIALANPWELREFRLLDPTPSLLSTTTNVGTPHDSFNHTPVVNNIINGITPLATTLTPNPQTTFMGATCAGGALPLTFWDGVPSIATGQRFPFSLGTCNGCHGRETDTNFVHVDPSTPGLPATLSNFLIGASVNDPVNCLVSRFFDDLDRRENDLNSLASIACFSTVPVNRFAVVDHLLRFQVLPEDLIGGGPFTPELKEFTPDNIFNPPIPQAH